LKTFTKNIGEKADDEDIRAMLKLADPEGSGMVDFDQFFQIMSTKYDENHWYLFADPKRVSNQNLNQNN